MIKLLKYTILAAFHQLLTLDDFRNLKLFFISARGSIVTLKEIES